MPRVQRRADTAAAERQRLEELLFHLQRERIGLTRAIMRLRGEQPARRPRLVLGIIVGLLRLQRANRRAMAALGGQPPR